MFHCIGNINFIEDYDTQCKIGKIGEKGRKGKKRKKVKKGQNSKKKRE